MQTVDQWVQFVMLQSMLNTFVLGGVFLFSLLFSPCSVSAQQQAFADVPPESDVFPAVEYLQSIGMIKGYADGTFHPERKVNRAEAVKIIITPKVTADALALLTTTVFQDIPADAWYLPAVEAARQTLQIIEGPPNKMAFNGERTVIQAEFLKMLLLAYKADPNAYGEIKLPLAEDVTNADEWYYPFHRYAIAASMLMAGEEDRLFPARELTRGDVALLFYRFLMYRENRRTQALLSETESEIARTLSSLDANNIVGAEHASARALLAARGAQTNRPDTPIVRGALRITQAFRALVRAYRAGLNKDFEAVISLSKEAWTFADQAAVAHAELLSIVEQIKQSAGAMAENARQLQGE